MCVSGAGRQARWWWWQLASSRRQTDVEQKAEGRQSCMSFNVPMVMTGSSMREPVIGQEKLSKAESSSMAVGGVAGTCGTVRCMSEYVGRLLRHTLEERLSFLSFRRGVSVQGPRRRAVQVPVCVYVCSEGVGAG